MVTITNGVKTFRVTAGAIKPYEGMGFHVVSDEDLKEMQQEEEFYDDAGIPEKKPERDVTNSHTDDEGTGAANNNSEEAFIEELIEKPLSQWTNDEVKEFVRIKGIDTSGAQKVSQVRGIIKVYLEELNKNA